MSCVNVGNDHVFSSDNILFVPGGLIRNYLGEEGDRWCGEGGNLRLSIHRGDTIGECLAPWISLGNCSRV